MYSEKTMLIQGMRILFQSSDTDLSFISQIRHLQTLPLGKVVHHTSESPSCTVLPRLLQQLMRAICEPLQFTFIIKWSHYTYNAASVLGIQGTMSSSFHLWKGGTHLAASKSLVWLAKSVLLFQIEACFWIQMWTWQASTGVNRFAQFKKKNREIRVCECQTRSLERRHCE